MRTSGDDIAPIHRRTPVNKVEFLFPIQPASDL